MSGIVAIVNLDGAPLDAALLGRLTDSLSFRGPDRRSVRVIGNAGLGHTLLRVDDESPLDDQPYTDDGRAWVIADARIDARSDLAAALRTRAPHGCADAAPDVELIARAYGEWGEDCAAHLVGDFAFVVWDAPRRRLFCARDHLGVKPLFYARIGDAVVVSNTLECIRRHPAISGELYEPAIADFLLFGANRESGTTVFRDIRRVPAAHSIAWSADTTRTRRYWTLPVDAPIHFRRAADYTDRFTELLQCAVRDRVRTRRAAVFMSGGIDSTTLAATARDVLCERRGDFFLQAMTCVYDWLIPDAERRCASLVAAHLRMPIRYDVRDNEMSIATWDRVAVRTPEPVENPAAYAAAVAFARRVAPESRLLLYGEGPDNALTYEWRPYLSHLAARRDVTRLVLALSADLVMHRRVPLCSSIRRLAGARRDAARWREPFPAWLDADFAARCGCVARWAAQRHPAPSPHPFRPRAYARFDALLWQPLFDYCDITSAASGTEIRHPFLDLRLLRFMLALPAMPWCRNKLIVRRSMRGVLPEAVLRRKKATVGVSADLARVKAFGFPRLTPTPALLRYVNPRRLPPPPRTEVELRAALRPLGLDYWLRERERLRDQQETADETATLVEL